VLCVRKAPPMTSRRDPLSERRSISCPVDDRLILNLNERCAHTTQIGKEM